MSRPKPHLHGIRLVYRRSSVLLKCAVLTAIVLSTAALLILRGTVAQEHRQMETLRQQTLVLQQENRVLEDRLSDPGSALNIRHAAAEKLGLTDPDTVFFSPQG